MSYDTTQKDRTKLGHDALEQRAISVYPRARNPVVSTELYRDRDNLWKRVGSFRLGHRVVGDAADAKD